MFAKSLKMIKSNHKIFEQRHAELRGGGRWKFDDLMRTVESSLREIGYLS